MNKRILSFILIFLGCWTCKDGFAMEGQSNSLYQKVGDLVLKSEDYIVKPSDVATEESKKTELAKLQEKASKFLATMSEVRQKELVFNLFSKVGTLTATEKSFEDYSLQELNIIIGSDLSRKMSLHNSIDRTETIAGSAVLASMLASPVSDLAVIQSRQRLINFLLNHEDLFTHLDSLVKEIKQGQGSLFNCWNPEAALDEGLRKLFYGPKNIVTNYMNKSPKNLQGARLFMLLGWGLNCIMVPPALLGFAGAAGFGIYNTPDVGAKIGIGLVASIYLGAIGYSLKVMLDQAKLMNSVLRNMHQRLRDISKVLQSFENIALSINDHTELSEGLSLINNMTNFVSDPKSISADLAYLKNLLGEPVFERERFGLLSHAGNVLAAHEYVDEVKDFFAVPLEAVGEIDAYLSIVKLIKEHQDKQSGFCFVDFVDEDKPLMDLSGVWSTLVGAENAKPANIVFGGDNHPNNATFTGPNGSGKSILMKAAITCDTLGRSFGIAPAKKAKMTLFKKVYTYVNVKEDPRLGLSTFMAQKLRGEDILNKLSLNPNERVLIIVDEPYSGTVGEAVDHETYRFASEIEKYPNAICLLATHTEKATELANQSDAKFANYHFKITEDDNYHITRTFELMPGICDWWYKDDARRSRYIDRFLKK